MGLLQAAYRTYEGNLNKVGLIEAGKEPLLPIAHIIANAHIEIQLSSDGEFLSAKKVPKEESKTVIPTTIESAGRVGDTTKFPHPLCEQLQFLSQTFNQRFEYFITNLTEWGESAFSHPKLCAVLNYLNNHTILTDLANNEIISLNESGQLEKGAIDGISYEKCLVRWRIGSPPGTASASWEDKELFEQYTKYYLHSIEDQEKDICFITGEEDIICKSHPKGVISSPNTAKLISAQANTGFTYRGRFEDADQAFNVGYTASQKAHNALHWIVANEGVVKGGRTFLCWNPESIPVPSRTLFQFELETPAADFLSYKKELYTTLNGYKQQLQNQDVVIAALDAATTGRLSVTYYNQLEGSDFLDRIAHWYETFCWKSGDKTYSHSFKQVIDCAFGTQRENYIETDNKVSSEHTQRLLCCMLEKKALPKDIVKALTVNASSPLKYKPKTRGLVLNTACAVIRKHHNDKANREVYTLALDVKNDNRSYLWGRLLAIAEKVERDTYSEGEGREPNAIKMQSVFSQRPSYAWGIIHKSLEPYFRRLKPSLRAWYKSQIAEILDRFDASDYSSPKKLDDIYLLGYYHQRSSLYTKKETTKEENENDSAEK